MDHSGQAQRGLSPTRRRWRRIARSVALALPFARFLLPVTATLPLIRRDRSDGAPPTTLLVFLPGLDESSRKTSVQSMIEHAWESGLAADAVEIDVHLGYCLRHVMVQHLKEQVIEMARNQGYKQIWLVGMSLGGAGVLAYAQAHPGSVEGIVLLGPYLGHRRFIDGLRPPREQYHAPSPQEFQHDLWEWLAGPAPKPPIYLGFGSEDNYSTCHRLMAEFLPRGRVFVTQGRHDWPTWNRLWEIILPRVITHPRHWA